MTASTMLQLKILRTKKRLSNVIWYLPIMILSTMGLMVILSFMLRSISTAGKYGIVLAEIPLIAVPVEEPGLPKSRTKPVDMISAHTPVIILTRSEFIIGDVDSFTEKLSHIRNKFIIPHKSGAPDIISLEEDMEKWLFARKSKDKIPNLGFAVLLPTDEMPSPIVIQVIHALKKSKIFERIVLAGGLK